MAGSGGGQVNHLDTISFNSTINAYSGYILSHWDGVGRDAFEKDCKQVQINLRDVADIMYDLRDALTNAHAEYMKTDNSLSKSFES